MTNETIRELTTSAIALVIIIGGGAIIFLQPSSPDVPFVTLLIGLAAGYYLNHNSQAAGANTVLKAQGGDGK